MSNMLFFRAAKWGFVNCVVIFLVPMLKALSIDHDHGNRFNKGLLCRSCNLTMAYLDDPEWLSKAF